MLNRHSVTGRKSDKLRSGIWSMPGVEAVSPVVSSVLVFWEETFPSFVKSILNTICGVVSDYLQCVHESVLNDSGRGAAPCRGRNFDPLLVSVGSFQVIPNFAISGRSPGCDIQMTCPRDSGAVQSYHLRTHSEGVLGNQIAGYRIRYLGDSLSRSPLKHNRAGNYEKGDCNQ